MEDLATDGGSKFMFADALRAAGAECKHILVIFYYDLIADTKKHLLEHGLELHYLATWWDILAELRSSNKFDVKTVETVEAFLHDPIGWSTINGGKSN